MISRSLEIPVVCTLIHFLLETCFLQFFGSRRDCGLGLNTTGVVDFLPVFPLYEFLLWGTGHSVSQVGDSSLCDLEPYLTCLSVGFFKVLVWVILLCVIQVLYCLGLKDV